MADVSLTILLGVISGVFTATLVYMSGLLFLKILVPQYQKVVYEGVDLNGLWSYKNDIDEAVSLFTLNLRQDAHELKGSLSYTKTTATETKQVSYSASGSVWEGYVTLNLKSTDRTAIAYATALLKVERGGHQLKGAYCYRNFRTDNVSSLDLEFSRK